MPALRIAMISAHTSPLAKPGGNKAGGLNVYVLELARRLAGEGCQVDIFSRSTSPQTPEISQLMAGLRVIHLPAGPRRFLSPQSIFNHLGSFEAALLDFQTREGLSYDLVHSHYWLSGILGENLKKLWHVPHVTMFHTLGEVKNRASVGEHESALRIDAETRIVAGADRIICATEQERTALWQLYGADPGKVSVIPLGVDLDLFQPVDKATARERLGLKDERIVLFVGRLEPLKGADILINAAAMLDSDIECGVLIVGGDRGSHAHVEQLKSLARQQGIEQRVAFVGAIDHDLLPLYYSAADVCVVPSHHESFGLVAVEAMASGTPVVASRVGGLTSTIRDGETGYLIPWLCPEPFAERIDLLLENESLRRSLGEAAREQVTRFRWENVVAAMIEEYKQLTGQRETVSLKASG